MLSKARDGSGHRALRLARWSIALAATAVAALAAVVKGGLTGLGLATVALAAGVVVLVPELLSGLRERRARLAAGEQRIRELLLRWPLTVTEADPQDLGVSESKIANRYRKGDERAPYIPRDQDLALQHVLIDRAFVLVVGPSKAGKSRTAFEAIRRSEALRRRVLIVPRGPSALRELAVLEPSLGIWRKPAVLWLDDLQDYLLAGALDVATLRQWRHNGGETVVLATIREGALADLRALESERALAAEQCTGKAIGDVLDQAEQIRLEVKLSEEELARAREYYPDQDFRQGIGARLIDAPRLVDRLRTGRARCPEGVAVARAAFDWRRLGVIRRPTKEDLARLYGLYLDDTPSHPANLERGLEWALERLESGAALLSLADDGTTYEAHDYIIDFLDGRSIGSPKREPIPEATWEEVISRTNGEDAVAVGLSAYRYMRSSDLAEKALAKVADSDEATGMAARALGEILERQEGRGHEAEAAYRRAIETADVEHASAAACRLGDLLARDGRADEAEAAYRRAIESGHEDLAPRAAFRLGDLLARKGRMSEAEAAYRRVIESGHENLAPSATFQLGVVLQEQEGRTREAEEAYRRVIDSGDVELARSSVVNLGGLLVGQGRAREAEVIYRRLIDSATATQQVRLRVLSEPGGTYRYFRGPEVPWQAASAAVNLGGLLVNQGRAREAEDVYRWAVESAPAPSLLGPKEPVEESYRREAEGKAALRLAELLEREGRAREAEEAYNWAIGSRHEYAAAWAAYGLGWLLEDAGRSSEAEDAFRRAVNSGRREVAPQAAVTLGALLQDQTGRAHEAEDLYRRAIDSGHPEQAPKAAVRLGVLLRREGRAREAEDAFRRAINSGHDMAAPMGAANLGGLLAEEGRSREAEDAFRRAIDSGQDLAAPKAAASLGRLLAEEGRSREAEAAYRQAIDSGDEVAPIAAVNLGVLLAGEGRSREAEAAWRQAIDSGDKVAPIAALNLGTLLFLEGRVSEAKDAYSDAISSGHEMATAAARKALLEGVPLQAWFCV